MNAHHDTGFVTLLWQHQVGGLQVQNQAGDWIDVPADDDAIVVNIGEMLQSRTGSYFVATYGEQLWTTSPAATPTSSPTTITTWSATTPDDAPRAAERRARRPQTSG